MSVEGPYEPLFDEFRLGFAVPQLGTVEGAWNPVGGVERVEARFHISGLGNEAMIRVDAAWHGSIVAHAVPATGRVTQVEVVWPDPGILMQKSRLISEALPTDPGVLENERRTRFLAHLRAALDQPHVLTDERFDEWLWRVGATSVGDLLARFRGTADSGVVQVTFSAPDAVPPSPTPLPIAAALLIRDVDFSVAQLFRGYAGAVR